MQRVRVPINSFQFGEVSDSLSMRVDSPVYASSVQTLQNMVVMPEGSVTKRYGAKHMAKYGGITYDANNPEQSHLFPFIYDENEEYIVAIQHQRIRVHQVNATTLTQRLNTTTDKDGATLPFDKAYLQEYTVAQLGNDMFICHPLFAPRILRRTSATSFHVRTFAFDQRADELVTFQPYSRFADANVKLDPDAASGDNVDFSIYTTDGTTDDDHYFSGTNSSGAGNLTLNSGATDAFDNSVEISLTSTGNISGVTFTFTGTDQDGVALTESIDGPNNTTIYLDRMFKSVATIYANGNFATTVKIGHTNKRGVTYLDVTGSKDTGSGKLQNYSTSKHLDVLMRYHKNELKIDTVYNSNQFRADILNTLSTRLEIENPLRTNNNSDKVEVSQPQHGFSVGNTINVENADALGGINVANINGSRTIHEIIDENTYSYTAGATANASADGGGFPRIESHAPTTDFDEQSFSEVRGYPAAVEFHQNRLVFAGTLDEPDTLFFSKIGKFANFDLGDAADDDAIQVTAATGDVNEIRYLVSNRDLQIFAAGAELYIPTFQNQALTPTNLQIKKQTPFGISHVQPIELDGATLFVQRNGKVVREYLFTDGEDAYTSVPVSSIASHMIDTPRYMAVVHSGFGQPDSYAAMTTTGNNLIVFSSNRAERKASWVQFTTAGKFGSVCAIEDRLFAEIYDTSGQLHVCEFAPKSTQNVGLDIWLHQLIFSNQADVSLAYNQGDVVDVIGTDVIDSYQEYLGTFTVDSNEKIDLSAYSGLGHTYVYVGKKFDAKIVTNEIDASMGNGPVTGEVRGIGRILLDVKDAFSLKVNNKSIPISSRTNPETPSQSILDPLVGKKEVRTTGYTRSPQVTIEQSEPLPLQVNGLVVELIV